MIAWTNGAVSTGDRICHTILLARHNRLLVEGLDQQRRAAAPLRPGRPD